MSEYKKIVENLKYYPDAANFLKYYKDGIFTPEKIEAINKMIEKNSNALRHMNFGIFQDKVFEIGPEFCEYMAKFPTLSYQLLAIKDHAPQILEAIASKVKTYDNLKDNLSELEVLITYSARNMFELENQQIDINEFLECAYRSSNAFELINVDYGDEYKKRLEEKLIKEYQNAETVKDKLNIYMNKAYSLSLKKAKGLLKEFGSDLQNLQNISEETKTFFKMLENVVEIKDEEKIDALFNADDVRYTATKIQEMKSEISKECAIEFAKEFQSTDQKIKQKLQENREDEVTEIEYNGKKIQQIRLNGKFNLLFHSTDTEFIQTKDRADNFKNEWNQGDNKKNHIISTAYVNQDLFGMAPVGANGVRYAFSTLETSDIRLMGVSDLNTYSNNFAYDSAVKQYMSAKTLAYNSRRVYSEFGIEREGVIPDYVAILDDDLPEVVENSYKAASQFNIPIIFINKAEIEQEQIQNLENLLKEFKDTKDTNILQRLVNTYETNVAGWLLNRSEQKDESHTYSIDNTRFSDDFKSIQIKIEDVIKQYLSAEKKEVQSEKEIYEVIKILLDEIQLYEGCEETKPISKTKISFSAMDLLKNANESLETIGKEEWKVDLDNLPTSKEYQIKIQELVKNALGGEKYVTIEGYR